jgi:hypothetical protein
VLPGLFVPAATLILMVIGWAFVAGTAATFAESVTDIGRAVTGRAEVRSDSARYALPPGAAATDEMVLSRYVTVVTQPRREQGAPPAGADCAVTVLPGDVLPTGPAGDAVAAAGVPPGTLNTAVRQSVVLLYEGGAILGCVLVWWRLRRSTGVRRAAAVLVAEVGTAAVGLLALSVVAPQVTDSYGLLRLYQQLLPVLGVTVVLALVTGTRLVTRRRPGRLAHAFAVAVVAGCLVTTSGLLPRLTGGYPPQLNSAASGPYQHGYLAGRADAAAAAATRERLPRDGWVIADTRDSLNLRALTPLTPDDGLAPGAVPVDAYLLARRTGGDRIAATAVIGDRIIRYTFPASCVTAGRSALWTGAEHVLYGPARPVTG